VEDRELTVPLASCFNLAGAPEALSVDEAWFCPRCKTARSGKEHLLSFVVFCVLKKKKKKKLFVSAIKTMSIWRAPPVLCVQLKRFKMDFVTREKLHTLVSFPQLLDMSHFVSGDAPKAVYQLVGVCNHIGGLSGVMCDVM
jgi:ubiquitin carboxyl-terminal hydrolase 4/11/15